MVHFCVVPGCSNKSDRDTHLSFHRLPLKNKSLLKIWIHKIGRKNLPLNDNSRVCSEHFPGGRQLLVNDEYPTLKLPKLSTQVVLPSKRRSSRIRNRNGEIISTQVQCADHVSEQVESTLCDKAVCTELAGKEIESLLAQVKELEKTVVDLKKKQLSSKFAVSTIAHDDRKVAFHTGFPTYDFMACFRYLGPAVSNLVYWSSNSQKQESSGTPLRSKAPSGRARRLQPVNEFFMTLVRLRLGLLEQDLADRFGISTSTVSRIFTTWINFLYLRLKDLPLWPPKEIIDTYMPQVFKCLYPTTRVIVDATEIYVEKPSLPDIQQMTFSSYKNNNTFKGLIGISPSCAISFIPRLFPGSISDKLTKQSGLLELLERGDSVMADRGFDIQNDLTPLGVRLNIPPFLKG